MKKLKAIMLLSFLFAVALVHGQTDNMVLIKGDLNVKTLPKFISLFTIKNGDTVQHSKVAVNKNGSFGFYFTPDYTGFYIVEFYKRMYRLYLSPGKHTEIHIQDSSFTVLSSDIENKKMVEWANIMSKLKQSNVLASFINYKEIFPLLPVLEKRKNEFVANLNTGNKEFDSKMKDLAHEEFEYEAFHFLVMPRNVQPKFSDYPSIYNEIIATPHFEDTKIMDAEFGQSYIRAYIMYLARKKMESGTKMTREIINQIAVDNIKNDTLKGWYFLNDNLLKARAYDKAYLDKKEAFAQYILTDDQKSTLEAFERTIRSYGTGEKAIDFSGKTVDGKKVSLSDLKGKIVLVDVWATWCAPCKAQIPSLQKLEEEFKGKDIVFLSYSIDKLKDADKWKKMVETEKLGGLQLMGENAFESPICKGYKITGIPRFMVFDKAGNIITTDAPRPSQPELKALLIKHLAK